MVTNDFREDIKEMLGRGMQSKVAYAMGISRQLFDGYIKWATITKGYTEMCDALGFDLEVKYVASDNGGESLNDFEREIRNLIERQGGMKKFLAESGLTYNEVRSRAAHAKLSRGMRDILEYLGYDYEVRYIRK